MSPSPATSSERHRRAVVAVVLSALVGLAGFMLGAAGGCSSSSTGAGGSTSTAGEGGFGGFSVSSTTGVGASDPVGGGGAGGQDLFCPTQVTNVPKGECDLYFQDCPPGFGCQGTPASNPSSTICVPTGGLKGPGEDCMVIDECLPGLFCIDQCTPPCCGTSNVPCGGGTCSVNVDFGGGKFVIMCSYDKSCNLLTAEACEPGTECHMTDKAQGLATCSGPSPSIVDEGQPCTFLNDCHDMQECFDASDGNGSICHYYCFLDPSRGGGTPGLGGCPAGKTCASFVAGGEVDLGIEGVGLCF